MARYQRQAAIGSIANPATEESRATMALADNLQSFGQYGMEQYARMRVEGAQEEAYAVEPGIDAPEQRTSATMTGRAYNDIVMAGHAAAIKNDYTKRIAELSVEHAQDPIAFQKNSEAYKSGLLNGVSPEMRNAVSLDYDAATIRPMAQIKKAHEKSVVEESVQGIVQAVNSVSEDMARAARDGDIVALQHGQEQVDIVVEQLREIGRDDLAQDVINKTGERIDKQMTLGQADKAIESGNGAAFIQGFIDNPPDDLSPEQIDSYAATMVTMNNRYKSLETQQKAAVSIDTMRGISNLKIAAKNGIGEPEDLIDQTEDYFNRGLISEAERTSVINNIISADNKAAKQAETYQGIAERLAGEDSVVVAPKDQDKYWEDVYSKQVEATDPVTGEMMTVDFVNKMKRVPAGLKAQLETYIMSDNPELMTAAVRLVDKIDETPGLVDSVFNSQQAAFVNNAVALSQTMEPPEAIALARELTDPANKARVEARESEIKEMKKGFSGLNYKSVVEDIFDPFGPGGVKLDVMHSDQIAREYQAVFESSYKAGMSEDKAKETAERKVKRDWSDWQGQAIKYSPDDFYSVAGSTDYVKDQLYTDVVKEFITEDAPSKGDIVLISTEETARTAKTGKPVYRVGVARDGGFEILSGYKWMPDMDKEIARVQRANEKLTKSALESSIKVDLPSMDTL